jgi:hypothetical protein
VKSWLSLTTNAADADLQRLITAMSMFVQSWTDRSFTLATYNEARKGHGGAAMVMRYYPVLAVNSVFVDGLPVDAANISFDSTAVYLTNGAKFNRGVNNIQIAYQAGYATVPADIEQAVIDTVALRWKERERIGMSSKGLAGETTSFVIKDLSAAAMSILNQYKRRIMV